MKENHCCQNNCQCAGASKKPSNQKEKCPNCGNLSRKVQLKTVTSLSKITPIEKHFNVCENADCSIVYFGKTQILEEKHLKTSIHFKKNSKIKYACYCNNITFAQARETAVRIKSNNWADIVKELKGKISKCECSTKNPLGECCSNNSFKEALKSKNSGAKK